MRFDRSLGFCLGAALLCGSSLLNPILAKPFMIVGLDEKTWWDDDGKTVLSLPDSVAHVMVTPDGKRALAVRFPAH